MKMKAAVLYDFNAPLIVEEVELEEPRGGEIRVKMVAAGICHSDLAVIDASAPVPLPVLLGRPAQVPADVPEPVRGLLPRWPGTQTRASR